VNRAARVIELDRAKTRRVSREIERDLRRGGARTIMVDVQTVEDVLRWRRAAIMAAHRMGHRATTYLWGRQLLVELDLPVTDPERREAAAVTSSILGLGRAGR
jgi:pyridoxal biosynthesis lyase PdxS